MQTKLSPPEPEELEIFSLLTKVPHCLDIAQGPCRRYFATWIPCCITGNDMLPKFLTFWFLFPNIQPTQNYILSRSVMFCFHLFSTLKFRLYRIPIGKYIHMCVM